MKVTAPLLCAALFSAALLTQSQTPKPALQVRTFHISGNIRDSAGSAIRDARVDVIFRNEKMSQTVWADQAGMYQADLPLGMYTMYVDALQFRTYRRPEFKVSDPVNVTLNVVLPHEPNAHQSEWRLWGAQGGNASSTLYYNEDFFSLPGEDGAPYRLYFRYVKRTRSDYVYEYAGTDEHPCDDPVFVAYDLFSLQANTASYDMQNHILEARGNVIAEDESGRHTAAVMKLKIENGRVTRAP